MGIVITLGVHGVVTATVIVLMNGVYAPADHLRCRALQAHPELAALVDAETVLIGGGNE